MKTTSKIIAALAAFMIVVTGCKKNETGGGNGYMAMQMTEARVADGSTTPPYSRFTAVNIDIVSVEVHYSDEHQGASGWVALETKAGIYDLLSLQNNVMATIAADTPLPPGKITQIRLILGPNNSVFIGNDAEQKLTVPSKEIKINVNSFVTAGEHLLVTLAFDADKSIVIEGNGSLILKPVIQVSSVVAVK